MFNNDELKVMEEMENQIKQELENYQTAISMLKEAEEKAGRNTLSIEEFNNVINAIGKLPQEKVEALKPFSQKVFDMLVKRLLREADYSLNIADLEKATDFILNYMETTSVYEEEITKINNRIIEKDNRLKEQIDKLLEEAKDSLKRKPIKEAQRLVKYLSKEADRVDYVEKINDIIEKYIKPKELSDRIKRNFKKAENFIEEADLRGEFEPLIDAKKLLEETEKLVSKVKDIEEKNSFNSMILDLSIKLSNVENEYTIVDAKEVDTYYPKQLNKTFNLIREELKKETMNVDALNELIKNASTYVKEVKTDKKRDFYIKKLETLIDEARAKEQNLIATNDSNVEAEEQPTEPELVEEQPVESETIFGNVDEEIEEARQSVLTDVDRERKFYELYKKAFKELDMNAVDEAATIVNDINNEELKNQLTILLNFEKDYVNNMLNVNRNNAPVGATEEESVEEIEEEPIVEVEDPVVEQPIQEEPIPVEEPEIEVEGHIVEEEPEVVIDHQDDLYNTAKEKVEIANRTRHPEDVANAANAIEALEGDSRKTELFNELAKAVENSNAQENIVEQTNENASENMTAFEASLNRAKEIVAINGNITNGRVNELVRLAKELDADTLSTYVNDVNDIIMYYNMVEAQKKQKEELADFDTKVGLLDKLEAMATAAKRKFRSKRKAKYIRQYNDAKSLNNTRRAQKAMDKILDSEDITNHKVIITATRIKSIQALLEDVKYDIAESTEKNDDKKLVKLNAEKNELEAELQDCKSVFENAVYEDLIRKITDAHIIRNAERVKGIITTIALCLSYYPDSTMLIWLKNMFMSEVEKEHSITDIEKLSYEYEFAKVKKFYELFGDLYTSYNAMDFEDLSKDEDFKQYGIHSIK